MSCASREEVLADLGLLAKAFSDDTGGIQWYLHVPTGRVLRATESPHDPSPFTAEDGYLAIERARSKEQYRWMERYITRLEDRALAAQLAHAIAGKQAFQRFKLVLSEHPGRLEDWQEARAEELARHMRLWLDAHHLVVPPFRPPPPAPAALAEGSANPLVESFEEALEDLCQEDLETLITAATFLLFRQARASEQAAVVTAVTDTPSGITD